MVERSAEGRILLRALFFADFKRIDEAADNSVGAGLLSSHRYSAIVLELLDDDHGGLIEFLTEHDPAALPRTIAIGRNSEPALLDAARRAGVAAVVIKPFDTSDLLSVVTSVAGGIRRSHFMNDGPYIH